MKAGVQRWGIFNWTLEEDNSCLSHRLISAYWWRLVGSRIFTTDLLLAISTYLYTDMTVSFFERTQIKRLDSITKGIISHLDYPDGTLSDVSGSGTLPGNFEVGAMGRNDFRRVKVCGGWVFISTEIFRCSEPSFKACKGFGFPLVWLRLSIYLLEWLSRFAYLLLLHKLLLSWIRKRFQVLRILQNEYSELI